MACLRRIAGVTRQDKIRNQAIRETLGKEHTVLDTISERRLKYFGHIKRMETNRYPKITIEGKTHGTRPRGRPSKRWLECAKADGQARGIPTLTEMSRLTTNRGRWQNIVKQKPSHSPLLVWTA
ncbi:uncharacterized protein [Amphiura filiformis]|uniref:uncharacterized protein n=1 Tax=Amphiura filiformis TaxID=82378 RepID=UPI003B2107AC